MQPLLILSLFHCVYVRTLTYTRTHTFIFINAAYTYTCKRLIPIEILPVHTQGHVKRAERKNVSENRIPLANVSQ